MLSWWYGEQGILEKMRVYRRTPPAPRLASSSWTRNEAISLATLFIATLPTVPLPALATDGVTAAAAQRQSEAMALEASGGLKPGTGRPLNALIKMRSETGVERTGAVETPLFKPGQCFDELRVAGGGAAEVAFSYPEAWTMASGPNLDVRDIKTSDSAFVLAAPLPAQKSFEALKDSWFMDIIFSPTGKYGSYGALHLLRDRSLLLCGLPMRCTCVLWNRCSRGPQGSWFHPRIPPSAYGGRAELPQNGVEVRAPHLQHEHR